MAMTKKEQAAMADLQRELAEARALRFTPLVERDLPAPDRGTSGMISGWDYNAYYMNAEQAWSESVAHGRGSAPKSSMSASQGALSLYSTKLLALKAMRNEMEHKAARELAKVDALIEQEAAAQAAAKGATHD
jgi:hypothetical protein